MKIEVLYHPQSPGLYETKRVITEILSTSGIQCDVLYIDVSKNEHPAFKGSPTILVDGRDIDKTLRLDEESRIRLYENDKPFPPKYLLEIAILKALKPKKILFMCVHNSARSILSEGIARHLAPADVEVLSAGSNPGGVKKEAIEVLKEAGIDTAGLYSKSVSDIDVRGVDAVITLCKEEVCPVFYGRVMRIHWPLDDPSRIIDERERIEAFRRTRDELINRLSILFERSI